MKKTPHTPKLVLISGPSGVGKGTIIAQLLAQHTDIKMAISATTRPPREGEINGESYYFLSEEEFSKRVQSGEFLEWCNVHTHRYGTLKSEVQTQLENGISVLLEIDVQGAKKIKKLYPQMLTVFLMPPSLEQLSAQLQNRKTESASVIQERLKVAKREIALASLYDHILVNNKIDDTVEELAQIIWPDRET